MYSIRLTPTLGKVIVIRDNPVTTKRAVTKIKILIAAGMRNL
ncbi:hypothetical protein [Listeria rocourtiae]|nr:hypothetical protein [Listeria rocourtiae]